jgi:hypothetical protein
MAAAAAVAVCRIHNAISVQSQLRRDHETGHLEHRIANATK